MESLLELMMMFEQLYLFLVIMNQQHQRAQLNQLHSPDMLALRLESNKIHGHGIDSVNHRIVDYAHVM